MNGALRAEVEAWRAEGRAGGREGSIAADATAGY
jgi:hypothetical protein